MRSRLIAGAAPMALGIALMATPAWAQDTSSPTPAGTSMGPVEGQAAAVAPASSDGSTDNEAIIVTGSRIASPNLESASPVTVVTSAEVKLTGTTRVEDLINSLPQVFAGQGGNISNGSAGIATVNLRGLGEERNLVLVNGRRVVPGDPTTSAVDINVIPAALIKRVDVLTGGASSVYGADAVTGVVNFVMDTDFEGFRIDGQYSMFNHRNNTRDAVTTALDARGFPSPGGMVTDGGQVDATAVFGTSFDDGRGHITAYAGYRKIRAVTQDRRDYSACTLGASSQAAVDGGANIFTCGGSATSANGSFIIYDSGGVPENFTSTFFQVGSDRTLIPGNTPYNFAPTNYYQRPDERYTAGFFAEYEISDAIKPYAEFMFMDDRTVAQIAPSGNFGNTFSLNCDNPLLSAQQRGLICDTENLLATPGGDVVGPNGTLADAFLFTDPTTGQQYTRGFAQILRRNVEGGPRQDDLQHTSYRGVLGAKGDLSPVWSYDAYYQYGRTVFAQTYLNDFSVTRINRALDVVTDPTSGNPVCRSVLSGDDPNCVPWDIFAPGGVSQEALNYLQTPGFTRGIVEEQVASASLTGQLGQYGIKTPWSEDGVGVAIGAEYRKESLEFNSDIAFQTGDLAGQGAPTLPVSGSFNVKEAFGEIRIPLVSRDFFHELSLTGGYRYSDYKNSGGGGFSTDTYKIEGIFSPIRDVTLRGGYNRAVRAPTVQDLFAPNRVALNGVTDPCEGAAPTASLAACQAMGVSAARYGSIAVNPAGQYNGFIGGNANLSPEKADTWTAGILLQPSFLPRFALSVDYFNIKLEQAIQGIGQDTILDQCVQTLDPQFCGLVQRDQFGTLWRSEDGFVIDTTQNIGGLSTKGIDVNLSYSQPIGSLGSLGLSVVGTWLDELVTDSGIGDPINCAGLYGAICLTPNPEWRHTARLTWTGPMGLGASLRWRYFDSVTQDTLKLSGVTQPANSKIPSVSYFDLALTARVGDNYNFRIGANNLLDKDPPLVAGSACAAVFCNGNTYSQVYDTMGRYIYAGVTLDF